MESLGETTVGSSFKKWDVRLKLKWVHDFAAFAC